MSQAAKLDALYAAIPAFTCRPGCGDCCGPVPFADAEWRRVTLHQPITAPRAGTCLDCQYHHSGGCTIYAQRPYVCRLFGASADPRMKCPHGCGPEVPLTIKQTDALTRRYAKLTGAKPAAWSNPLGAALMTRLSAP